MLPGLFSSCREVGVTMTANRDHRAARAGGQSAHQSDEDPYELVTVCLGAIFGVALIALVIWFALGGAF